MKYRLAICDDEEVIRTILQQYILEISQEEQTQVLVESYESPIELIEQVQKNPTGYDLIFLDIDMPEMNGIELGKKIKELNEYILITFVTAHDKYALKAFEADAFQYILKPVKKDKLREALLKSYRLSYKINRGEQRFITIQGGEAYIKVFYKDILYFEKYRNKIRIICEDCEYATYLTFRELKEILGVGPFVQCHQSIMVHKERILGFKQNKSIILDGKHLIPVSRSYIRAIKDIFYDSLRG